MMTIQSKVLLSIFFKSVNDTQSHYPVGEIELLAIIEALKHFRFYLHGHKFIFRTDYLSILSYNNKAEPSTWVARWLETLAGFDFTLEYIKDSKNVVADALCRPKVEVGAIQVYPLSHIETVN